MEETPVTCQEITKMVSRYIDNQLNDKEMESFIQHVRSCPSCYEELETYFIISLATRVLDDSSAANYNIKALLEQNLKENEKRLRHRKIRFWLCLFLILIFLVLDVLLTLHWLGILPFPFAF
ncbi:MAG: zf-HC2 domain-containing protein [Lachnospiraceae bacterium]|nr:zf-HC2 domain-containing protein [Lachnospiraceae bacterium]